MLDLEVCDIALSHDSNWAVSITHVGHKFEGGIIEFRNALSKFSIECGFEFIFVKNDKVRVTAQCLFRETKGYMWNVHGRVENANGFFYVRKLNNVHTCGAEDFKLRYGLRVSYRQAWLEVEKAKCEIFGDYLMSFDQLRWYVDVAKSCNLGSYIEFECDDDTKQFKRLYVSFNGSISGFDYCRPLLFLDGTFLKGRFRGNLLAVTGKDGNQGFFPVCFAVVGSENQDNWHWFLEHLSRIMNLRHHLRGMFHGLKEKLITLFGKCTYAPTEETFHQCLVELKTEGGLRVKKFLDDIPYDHWSNAYFRGQRFGEIWPNVAESFNSWI
ncbi:uncharacterized protein LOC114266823 [Camellia sinensis]|uniref:uncharacterized protein LOC114266823 n=1 Tax=Camellia sinensis TaxID=4442 RepID=UPI00103659D9|nr:uncharacterized protein LOC114266823 [Camellia sinensis]